MSTILEFLGTDHRVCDDWFAAAEAAVAQKRWDEVRGLSSSCYLSIRPRLRCPELSTEL